MRHTERGIYTFAGHAVELISEYPALHTLCRDYRTDGAAPEFTVRVTADDRERERNIRQMEDVRACRPRRPATPALLETLAAHRALTRWLLDRNVLLLHASALALDGQGYVFCAARGVGKSSHAARWREAFGSRVTMINDDKPLVALTGDGAVVYGTPWSGKHALGAPIARPLARLGFLERSATDFTEPLTAAEALQRLTEAVYLPPDREGVCRALALCGVLAQTVPAVRIGATDTVAAAHTARQGMAEEHPL